MNFYTDSTSIISHISCKLSGRNIYCIVSAGILLDGNAKNIPPPPLDVTMSKPEEKASLLITSQPSIVI